MPTSIFFDQSNVELVDICTRWNLQHSDDSLFEFKFENATLTLHKRDEPKLSGVVVDFVTGAVAHRRKFGGGKGQAIAKAVGFKNGNVPSVIDATAGLGRDAFVLASLGCKVTLIERQPIVAALLEDGLNRAYRDPEIGTWVQQRMSLHHGASQTSLTALGLKADVVYLDPMYPHREKSAQVKKEMRLFQTLVGSDEDADELLSPALIIAQKRVVVKRPDYAKFIDGQKPSASIKTKKNRFDIYSVL
ncbi:class I SAM-dependent methyltransferase [Shewanella sp. 202IG2-18]|uniref:class I SAM-dependent methyltransferase n=1 Tax=Parashewanella hymeniacidonis TaxID=2807618 RepID=UPI0019616105|nr:class I SAM-dependent methyltransferase [Parashewanella hymeniacidonis]MBM7072776.1 class I SAM-dependent methyltransferase [Parashewanella hymeniacidonis]